MLYKQRFTTEKRETTNKEKSFHLTDTAPDVGKKKVGRDGATVTVLRLKEYNSNHNVVVSTCCGDHSATVVAAPTNPP